MRKKLIATAGLATAAVGAAAFLVLSPFSYRVDGTRIDDVGGILSQAESSTGQALPWYQGAVTGPLSHTGSQCFLHVSQGRDVEDILCGPTWPADWAEPGWTVIPLTVTTDAGSAHGTVDLARGPLGFLPAASVDPGSLRRPDGATPLDASTLSLPDAALLTLPIVESPTVIDGFITETHELAEPTHLVTDGFATRTEFSCTTLVGFSLAGRMTVPPELAFPSVEQGAAYQPVTVQAPAGHQLLILETTPGCTAPEAEGITPATSAATALVLDSERLDIAGWSGGTAAFVVPEDVQSVILESTLAGEPVWVDLMTGETDQLTAANNE